VLKTRNRGLFKFIQLYLIIRGLKKFYEFLNVFPLLKPPRSAGKK
jgi:hypothetical protein